MVDSHGFHRNLPGPPLAARLWDREMLQLCSRSGRAELRGSAKDLVEPVPVPRLARGSAGTAAALSLGLPVGRPMVGGGWLGG